MLHIVGRYPYTYRADIQTFSAKSPNIWLTRSVTMQLAMTTTLLMTVFIFQALFLEVNSARLNDNGGIATGRVFDSDGNSDGVTGILANIGHGGDFEFDITQEG